MQKYVFIVGTGPFVSRLIGLFLTLFITHFIISLNLLHKFTEITR